MDKVNGHYKARYGQWAGNPNGHLPDFDRCCENLRDRYQPGGYQCTRKRGYGPDGAYCKQHDPAAVAEREAKSKKKYDEQWHRRRLELGGRRFYEALRKIADGHNDPRALAQETIAPYLERER